tara:strand:+ start:1038 stop:1184 length:147 start_codon:yes stop_codon:yes gene_type:complete
MYSETKYDRMPFFFVRFMCGDTKKKMRWQWATWKKNTVQKKQHGGNVH